MKYEFRHSWTFIFTDPIFLETISPPRGSSLLAFLIIGNAIASVMANFIKKIITFSYELEMWWFCLLWFQNYNTNLIVQLEHHLKLIWFMLYHLGSTISKHQTCTRKTHFRTQIKLVQIDDNTYSRPVGIIKWLMLTESWPRWSWNLPFLKPNVQSPKHSITGANHS